MSISVDTRDWINGSKVEEIKYDDSYLARVTSLERDLELRIYGGRNSSDYQGVLFTRPTKMDQEFYHTFELLARGMEEQSGRSSRLDITPENFVGWAKHPGTYHKLGPLRWELNTNDRTQYSPNRNEYIRKKGSIPGWLTSSAAISGMSVGVGAALAVGLFAALTDCSVGLIRGLELREGFHGLAHFPTEYVLSKYYNTDRILSELTKTHQKAQSLQGNICNMKKYHSLCRKMEDSFAVLEETFKNTELAKGFFVTYSSRSLDDVYNTFSGILAGINVITEEEPEIVQDPSPIIDPWKVEIPEIKNVLQGGKER